MTSRRSIAAAGLLPLILLLAACSSGGGATASPSAAPASVAPSTAASEPPSEAPSEAPPSTAAGGIELKVVDGDADLGKYLTGEDGLTLYTFTADTKDSGKSTCNGDCAVNWPPLMADSAADVTPDDGVTGTIAVITRDDGTSQVSYNGWPLYYFKNDTAAGQTNGQGLQDKWFVAAP
jgi:predicted lipoprotein with Yx(FWY)xxD motif